MKKTLFGIMGLLSVLTVLDANAATNFGARSASSADLSGAPAVRTREKVNYQKYQTRTTTKTYETKDAADLYYTKPANRSALYKQYEGASSSAASAVKTTKRTTRSEKVVNKLSRKYFIAHPFYQPLGGVFGSVTDLGYTSSGYDFDIATTTPIGGNWDMSRFTIKEDLSYGITDTIAMMAMLQFDMDEYKFEWDDNSSSDKMDDNGLNMFGIGGQWRFMDNEKWIGMASAYYQHQKDISDNFLLEVKAGYKIASSTVYGLMRGWYLALDGNSYGNGVEGKDEAGNYQVLYMPYQIGEDSAIYFEGGMGVFSVLNKDWTLNLEGVFGHYDWHNSATIKGAIGWQPNDWFALNLYAKTVFWDSADGKKLDTLYLSPDLGYDQWTNIGKAKLDNYAETSIGLQVMFQF